MKYIFFLGKIPSLSLAEIQAMLGKLKLDYKVELINPAFAILDIKQDFSIRNFFVQIGGTPKIAEMLGTYNQEELREKLADFIKESLEKHPNKKSIGYSIYFTEKEDKNKEAETEKHFRDMLSKMKREELEKFSIRIVYPEADEIQLSTASIFNNRLTNPAKGVEFNLIIANKKVIASKTIIVQDIESYSMRDYEKPGRDARIGMMPPKLAQAMINLAQPKEGQTIFDPFCGTGTILQEALLNDYRVIGSDANGEQITKCKKNLEWISQKYVLTYPDYKIFQASFTEALRKLKPNSIDAVVTESTLGPVYKKIPSPGEIKNNYAVIKKLCIRFFQSAKPALKNKGRLVITLPAYQLKPKQYVFGEFIDSLEKLGYSVVCPLDKEFQSADIRITKRNSVIYSRPEQIVAREIIVFQNDK